jgi:holliday junction DNA helicase RuvA
MIGKLTGKLDELEDDSLILDVGGAGYKVFVSTETISEASKNMGKLMSLFIETHVREDHIHLYGFRSREEKNTFNMLQTVSGIGARMAMSILSQSSPARIQGAIDTKDKAIFTRISGIGPKLADRMLIELKGKRFADSIDISGGSIDVNREMVEDAAGALVNLGIGKTEAVLLVKNIMQNNPNAAIDEIIKIALQNR